MRPSAAGEYLRHTSEVLAPLTSDGDDDSSATAVFKDAVVMLADGVVAAGSMSPLEATSVTAGAGARGVAGADCFAAEASICCWA